MLRKAKKIPTRWWVSLIVLIVVAGGGVTAWRMTRPSTQAVAFTTRTVAAQLQTLKSTVSTSGTIEPATQSDLTFPSAGTVTSVKVSPGDKVAKGQALATMDDTSLRNALALAQADLAAAQTTLSDAQAAGGSSTKIAADQAQVSVAQSSVADAQTALGEATMTSPIDGIVAAVNIATGDKIGSSGARAGSTGSGSAAAIVVITNTSWIVDASVGSADLASLQKGLQAVITPTDSTTSVFGTIASVGVVASSSSSGGATFPVVIKVTGSPTGLYAGGTASVDITVKEVADALTVPTAAVLTQNGQTIVHQVKNGQTVSTPVTVGMVSGTVTQITKGLGDGDQVVVEGFARTATGGATSGRPGGFGGGGFGGGGFGGGNFSRGGQ